MDPTRVNPNFIGPLIGFLVQGIDHGKLDQASKVLGALRVMRPELHNEFFEFSMWILIKRGDYIGAARELNLNPYGTAQWHAMMSLCLAAMGDATWNSHADLVLEGNDPVAKALVLGLRGQRAASADGALPPVNPGAAVDMAMPMSKI